MERDEELEEFCKVGRINDSTNILFFFFCVANGRAILHGKNHYSFLEPSSISFRMWSRLRLQTEKSSRKFLKVNKLKVMKKKNMCRVDLTQKWI